MKKLELKHLAPYLPYGLKGKTKYEIEPWKIIGFIEDSFSITEPTLLCTHSTYNNVINIWTRNIKPILRPLSDLTKEIEYKGETIRTIDYISTSKANSQRIMRRVINQQNLDCLEYWQFERLLSLHFDVFGLIENGLAIDINTIK